MMNSAEQHKTQSQGGVQRARVAFDMGANLEIRALAKGLVHEAEINDQVRAIVNHMDFLCDSLMGKKISVKDWMDEMVDAKNKVDEILKVQGITPRTTGNAKSILSEYTVVRLYSAFKRIGIERLKRAPDGEGGHSVSRLQRE